MELLETQEYYILNKGEDSLWFNKKTGSYSCKTCWDLASAGNPTCLGTVYGLLGKLQIVSDGPIRLGLITSVKDVGSLYNQSKEEDSTVYCIKKVYFLPLTPTPDSRLTLDPCKKHTQHPNSFLQEKAGLPFSGLQQKVGLSKTFGTIKNVTSSIKNVTVNAAVSATGQNKAWKVTRDKEKYERRILDELNKMFCGSDSFYFCNEADIASSIQKQIMPTYDQNSPLWQRADDKFFWNKFMLSDFIENEEKVPASWLVPVIQGFVQIECISQQLTGDMNQTDDAKQAAESTLPCCSLILISRRSRYRAGTRYKRRGVDENGHVANYVESEQIIRFSDHTVSFVLVRGSVPLYWSQPGFKYRPPPRLDKSSEECAVAFRKHFDNEIAEYGNVTCVNLVDANGKEKVLAEAYLEHIFLQDTDQVSFVSFDFHEYCRGMRYENVCVLIEGIEPVISKMSYCWVDKEGLICRQQGVFRVNCVDCLDRTNVVQTALARCSLESQFVKLGVIAPEQPLPDSYKSILQVMWANNGDTLSKQYAGTSALKGDFTRTGERKFSGLMKDGMNSANRYYMNRFKDAYRQATIDTMLGGHVTEDFASLAVDDVAEEEDAFVAQRVKHIIDDCKKFLVPDVETILGAWGLIDADPTSGDLEQTDMDVILILTRDSYYAAEYDEATDRVNKFERVSLIDLDGIEMGPYAFQGVFKQTRTMFCIRLLYQVEGQSGYFHMFRSMNIRFFNNLAVTIKTDEEYIESIKSIGDNFEMASQMIGCNVSIATGKLEKKRSRGKHQPNPLHLLNPIASFTKRSPESLRNAGTRAFNNMTSGLARLNPINLKSKKVKEKEQCQGLQPVVSITEPLTDEHFAADNYLESCGILAYGIGIPVEFEDITHSTVRCQSLPYLSTTKRRGSATPEITVSCEASLDITEGSPLTIRTRHLSRSSNEVDPRDCEEKILFQKASSTSGLDLELERDRLEGKKSSGGDIFSRLPLSPLSPLATINKETVLAPFSVIARGVQSLAPNAGKLAKGMQTLGASHDPRKLKLERQLELEKNLELKKKILQCKSTVLLF